jgi:hypothetical protein
MTIFAFLSIVLAVLVTIVFIASVGIGMVIAFTVFVVLAIISNIFG